MRKLLIMLVILSGCYNSIPCPQKEVKQEVIQEDRDKSAWEAAALDEVLETLESGDITKWKVIAEQKVVICNMMDLGFIHLKYSLGYMRISLFEDGVLYIDGYKKDLNIGQVERMKKLYLKVRK